MGSSHPRVFLAENIHRFDLSAAERFGELVYLSDDPLDPFNPTEAARFFSDKLKFFRFTPSADYICMTGNTIVLAVLLASATALHKEFRLLLFDARKSLYKERVIQSPAFIKEKQNEN